jgi:hypothetical protein
MTSRHAFAVLRKVPWMPFNSPRILYHCSLGRRIGVWLVLLAALHNALDGCYLFVRNRFGIVPLPMIWTTPGT